MMQDKTKEILTPIMVTRLTNFLPNDLPRMAMIPPNSDKSAIRLYSRIIFNFSLLSSPTDMTCFDIGQLKSQDRLQLLQQRLLVQKTKTWPDRSCKKWKSDEIKID